MSTTDTDAQDQADMRRLMSGQDAALNSLMERHAGPIYQFLFRMVSNGDEANDLAQEAFLRVYRARDSFRLGSPFTTWLYTIAANLARNHLRWRSRHPNISLDAEDAATGHSLSDVLPAGVADPSQATQATELHQAVRTAVASLPEDMREAIVLCEWEELSMAEAAVILQTTAKAVENRLYRARKILYKALGRVLA